ncbi:MAG TPA: hypothetical protein VJ982_05175 [Gemmatimonadota bacterium]|nr:hypothetical protein [Gemmatimonadota bacterium]
MEEEVRNTPVSDPKRSEYEAPQVERVMEADELAREVHYAGSPPVVSE